jgi:hypothetical protein
VARQEHVDVAWAVSVRVAIDPDDAEGGVALRVVLTVALPATDRALRIGAGQDDGHRQPQFRTRREAGFLAAGRAESGGRCQSKRSRNRSSP